MPAGLLVPSRSMLPSMSMPHQSLNAFGTSSLTLGPSTALVSVSKFSHIMDQREKQTKEEQEARESRSSSDNGNAGSADERDNADQRPSKKSRYHRHSAVQIQEMERLFKECQHPDEKRRLELSKRLGLDPRQVKFWFQNKRTQIKAQVERQDNSHLRSDNEKLRAENYALREAIRNVSCPNCGGPTALGEMSFDEQQLHIENAKLREEIDKISAIAAKYVGRPIPSALSPVMSSPPGVISSGLDHQLGYGEVVGPSVADVASRPLGLSDVEKSLVLELAITSLEELVQVAKLEEPLWMFEPELGMEVLDLNYYFQRFPRGIGPTPIGLQSEASRATGLVIMNPNSLVDTLMDANRWSDLFSCIILRAATVEVLSAGVGGTYDGAMQLMYAELHLQTPLVPSREIYFLRYSKRIEGAWVVVDVAVDNLRGNPPPALLKCRRRPSGCIIEESPNGYSKITWLEHVEVDTSGVHQLYQSLVTCGRAFGAQRWVATLLRQSDRLVTTSMSSPHDVGVAMTPEGRRSMLRLAERMTHSFCGGVSASSSHTWITLSGAGSEDVRVLIRKSVDEPGKILSAATSLWLPVPPSSVFDYLSNEVFRKEWDALSRNGTVEEKVHVSKGSNPGNSVSLLRVNIANSNESNMLILQDCCTDDSCSLVVYAPVDITAMSLVLNGGDADTVALLPSGFAILPDGNNENGCLLTVAFQILVDHVPSAKLSLGNVATVNNLISSTVTRIKSALLSDTAV